MANYGRGWDDGYGGQSAEAQDAHAEMERIEGERLLHRRPSEVEVLKAQIAARDETIRRLRAMLPPENPDDT